MLYDPCRYAGLQVVLQALISGSKLVLPSGDDHSSTLKEMINFNVNALSATPSMWRKVLMTENALDLPIKRITLGGEIADQPLLARLKVAYPQAKISHIYASTEAGVGFSVKDGYAGFPVDWLNSEKSGVFLSVSDDQTLLIKPPILAKGMAIESALTSDGLLDTGDVICVERNRIFFCEDVLALLILAAIKYIQKLLKLLLNRCLECLMFVSQVRKIVS